MRGKLCGRLSQNHRFVVYPDALPIISRTKAAASVARRGFAYFHDSIQTAEGFGLLAAIRMCRSRQRHQCCCKSFGRAMRIEEIRARRFRRAQDWQGSLGAILRIRRADDCLDQRYLIRRRPSERRRAPIQVSRCRIWSEPPAPVRNTSCLSSGSVITRAGTGHAETAFRTVPARLRHRRHNDLEGPNCSTTRAIAAPKTGAMRRISPVRLPGKTKTRGGSAQTQSLLEIIRPKSSRRSAQGMPHKGAGRPAELFHHRWLKRQQRQHVIDISPHASRAAGPPCPDRGTDIVDDRNVLGRVPARVSLRDG